MGITDMWDYREQSKWEAGWLGLPHVEKDLCQGQVPGLPRTDLLLHTLGVPGSASPFFL